MSTSPRLEELLAHAAWARTLARSLVADPNVADDLVQEAYAAAASGSGPSHGEARGWLAEVLRNFARRRHRAESARSHREAHVSRPEATSSAAELVERAQLEHALAAAVIALDEPLRETVLLRYFEGVTSAEIARRQGVPESTVRNRLARALEQLRARLDRERGGRDAWMGAFVAAFGSGALVPTAPPDASTLAPSTSSLTTAAVGTGGLVMVSKLVVGAVVVGAVGIGAWVWTHSTAPDAATAIANASSAAEVALEAPAPNSSEQRTPSATPVDTHTVQPTTADTRALLVGRFVDEHDRPVAGVELTLKAELAPGPRTEAAMEAYFAWVDIDARSGSDGRFELAFEPRAELGVRLAFHAPGRAIGSRSWANPSAGAEHDLGDVHLVRGGAIAARVLDASGLAQSHTWRVIARPGRIEGPKDYTEGQLERLEADADHVFHFDDLPPGRWNVSARSELDIPTADRTVLVEPGEREPVDLPYGGPELAHAIFVAPVDTPSLAFGGLLRADSFTLSGPGIDRRPATQLPNVGRTFAFADLPDGEFTVEFEDSRFEPWRSDPVRPGSTVHPKLDGNAAVIVRVRDAEGAPWTKPFALKVETAGQLSNRLLKRDTEPVPNGERYALTPGDYRLTVLVDGRTAFDERVDRLVRGEQRVVDARIEDELVLAGVVLEGDGRTPAAGARVGLYQRATEDDSANSAYLILPENTMYSESARGRVQSVGTTAGPNGRFRLEHVRRGEFVLRADLGPGRFVVLDPAPMSRDEREMIRLVLPEAARLSGRLLLPSTATSAALSLVLSPASTWRVFPTERRFYALTLAQTQVDADGRFEFTGVGAGPHVLVLVAEPQTVRSPILGEREYLPPEIQLDAFTFVAGEHVEREYDLRSRAAQSLDVRVTTNGRPAERVVVVAIPAGLGHGLDGVTCTTDEHGAGTLGPLAPGAWRVRVYGREDPWMHEFPQHVEVPSPSAGPLVIDVPLVEGTLSVRDGASELPLRNARVIIFPGSDDGEQGIQLDTDASGELKLRLAPGRYDLLDAGNPKARMVPIQWTAAGPVPDAITFARP